MSIYKTALTEQQETVRLESIPTIEVEYQFEIFNDDDYEYTIDDYMLQAGELGLVPVYSKTYAEMRMSSMQLSWNTATKRDRKFSAILNNLVTRFPQRISFGV